MTFHGKSRASAHVLAHVHESPLIMLVPLALLALGSIGAGFLFKGMFIGEGHNGFWRSALFMLPSNHILEEMHHVPAVVIAAPFIMMALGFLTAWLFYIVTPSAPKNLADAFRPLYLFLLNKWYFDELYDAIFTRPAHRIGRFLWKKGDGATIDGLGPDGIAARVIDVTRGMVRLQSGYVYHYAFAMLIGVVLLATWFMFAGGAPK
jgi:NADH-quinone oxidoreductase subunit L